METLKIEIINPKAKKVLQELANLQLINIKNDIKADAFELVLKQVRKVRDIPALEEITDEVKSVRKERYASKTR